MPQIKIKYIKTAAYHLMLWLTQCHTQNIGKHRGNKEQLIIHDPYTIVSIAVG